MGLRRIIPLRLLRASLASFSYPPAAAISTAATSPPSIGIARCWFMVLRMHTNEYHFQQLQQQLVCTGRMPHLITQRQFSSDSIHNEKMPYEEETEKTVGWLIKLIAAATLVYVGFNFFPLMGDTFIRHSVALLRTKDPFFRRSGASRLTLIATNDERRKSIVEAGGIEGLFKMLESASDDKTRLKAVKALETLSHSDVAVEALRSVGAEDLIQSLSMSSFDLDIQKHSSLLLQRLDKFKQGRNE